MSKNTYASGSARTQRKSKRCGPRRSATFPARNRDRQDDEERGDPVRAPHDLHDRVELADKRQRGRAPIPRSSPPRYSEESCPMWYLAKRSHGPTRRSQTSAARTTHPQSFRRPLVRTASSVNGDEKVRLRSQRARDRHEETEEERLPPSSNAPIDAIPDTDDREHAAEDSIPSAVHRTNHAWAREEAKRRTTSRTRDRARWRERTSPRRRRNPPTTRERRLVVIRISPSPDASHRRVDHHPQRARRPERHFARVEAVLAPRRRCSARTGCGCSRRR